MTVTILICSYGTEHWRALGNDAALQSAQAQEDATVIRLHEPHETDISTVRNQAAHLLEEDTWLCFLDADDWLAPDYIQQLSWSAGPWSPMMMLVPSVQYGNAKPKTWPRIDIREGNWMVIGTLIHSTLFHKAGGFRPGLGMYEDWDLFARCIKAGGEPFEAPRAVYHANHTPNSRNRSPGRTEKLYWHQHIGHLNWPDVYGPTEENENRRHRLMTKHLRRIL